MQSVVILFQVCFPVSRAHSDVALCDMAIDISQCKTDELLIDKKNVQDMELLHLYAS